MLSVVILFHNKAPSVLKTIRSVKFSDDIILLADEDATEMVPDNLSIPDVRYISRSLDGDFSGQRNYGMTLTKHDWVLFLDSDEELSPELQKEVINTVSKTSPYHAYRLKRTDFFWDHELRFGEVKQVREKGLIRLVRKGSGVWKGTVHEVFKTSRPVGLLPYFMYHYPHQHIAEFLEDINEYSSLRARELVHSGKHVSLIELLLYPWGKFAYTYFVQMGFRDKAPGFIYAFMMSFHSFLVRAKVIQMTELKLTLPSPSDYSVSR